MWPARLISLTRNQTRVPEVKVQNPNLTIGLPGKSLNSVFEVQNEDRELTASR